LASRSEAGYRVSPDSPRRWEAAGLRQLGDVHGDPARLVFRRSLEGQYSVFQAALTGGKYNSVTSRSVYREEFGSL
jgi:hypothetical protein